MKRIRELLGRFYGHDETPETDVAGVFTDIYRSNGWQDQESVSGRGSTLWRTEAVRRELPDLLRRLGVRSLLDVGCGDFNWLRTLELPLGRYVGTDVVAELVAQNQQRYGNERRRFLVADARRDRLPDCDAVMCRDCLIHLSYDDIFATLANLRRTKARFVLLTTHEPVRANTDCHTGEWRSLNLRLPPFNLPEPVELMLENADLGKYLGVWPLTALPK